MPTGFRKDGSKLGFQKGCHVNLGRVFTKVHRDKLSESHKNQVAWHKGKKGVYSKEALEKFRHGLQEWKDQREKIFAQYGWRIIFLDETQVNEEKVRGLLL